MSNDTLSLLSFDLQEEPIRGFKISSYLEFMEGLERNYRNLVLSDMKDIKNPVD